MRTVTHQDSTSPSEEDLDTDTDNQTQVESEAPTISTPPESVLDSTDVYTHPHPPPRAGKIYTIRAINEDLEVTLLGGQVVLVQPGGLGSSHWECVESAGWYGFRNVVSNLYLGHNDKPGILCCSANRHRDWEHFHLRPRTEGGYSLVMKHWNSLQPVRTIWCDNAIMLKRVIGGDHGSTRWEFVEYCKTATAS